MIKLSRPKAYGEIKPLCDSTGQPIRCAPSHVVIPEIGDRPDCAMCLTRACQTGGCDWPEESQP
jgi:hypothetical protein